MTETIYIYSYLTDDGQTLYTTNFELAKARATFYDTEHVYVHQSTVEMVRPNK